MRLNIIAKTRAKETSVVELTKTTYEVKVTAPAVAGKANEAIILALADHFRLHPNQIILKSGFTSKNKTIEVIGYAPTL